MLTGSRPKIAPIRGRHRPVSAYHAKYFPFRDRWETTEKALLCSIERNGPRSFSRCGLMNAKSSREIIKSKRFLVQARPYPRRLIMAPNNQPYAAVANSDPPVSREIERNHDHRRPEREG